MNSKLTLERMKTSVLCLLVASSLVLSYALWNDTPVSDSSPVAITYTPASALGPGKTVNQVALPAEIVIHEGDDGHVVLRPFTDPFNQALDLLKKIAVTDWVPIDFTDDLWHKISSSKAITVKDELPPASDRTDHALGLPLPANVQQTAWLHYYKEGSDLRIIVQSGLKAYTSKAILPIDLNSITDKFSQEPVYSQYGTRLNPYYLPTNPLQVLEEHFTIKAYQVQPLVNSFFVDLSLIRTIKEPSGNQIYTDGARGVQMDLAGQTISYTNYSLQAGSGGRSTANLLDNGLKSALDFTNSHGGLNGNFRVSLGDAKELVSAADASQHEFTFRKYVDGFPVFDSLSSVKVWVGSGGVETMGRPLFYLTDSQETAPKLKLLAADALWLQLDKRAITTGDVTAIELVLHTVSDGSSALSLGLYPVWEVTAKNKQWLLDGVTGADWTDSSGWLDGLG
ncbi:MAG: hypothetical protein JWN30_572 [Bacilli bacterium]|nr:hypothetical protein [Bacilli bacterium]